MSGASAAASRSTRSRAGSDPATGSGSSPTRQSTTTSYAPSSCAYSVRNRSYLVLPSPYSRPPDQKSGCRAAGAAGVGWTRFIPTWNSGVSAGDRGAPTASTTRSNGTDRRSNPSITVSRTRVSSVRKDGSPRRSTRSATMSTK